MLESSVTTRTQLVLFSVLLSLATLIGYGCSHSATAHQASADQPRFSSFGKTGLGPGEFKCPRVLESDSRGRIFVLDKSGRVQRFSRNGRFQLQWELPDCELRFPSGMDVGPDGNVYIADTHNSRVLVYDENGRELHRFGSRGVQPGRLMLVTDVAVAPDGTIYVTEFGASDRVSKFDAEGHFLFAFGDLSSGPGALQRPSGLACDSDNIVWVADTSNHRICRFDSTGEFLGSFGELGREPGKLRYPRDVAIIADDVIAVVGGENDRVQYFSKSGKWLGTWGTTGRGVGEFSKPLNIASSGQRIYVADSANNRVVILSLDWTAILAAAGEVQAPAEL